MINFLKWFVDQEMGQGQHNATEQKAALRTTILSKTIFP